MAVHHFVAVDLINTPEGWEPLATFPHDGDTVEVRDTAGAITTARWEVDHILIVGPDTVVLGDLSHWRNLTET